MFHILFQKSNSFYESIFEKWGRFLAKYHVYIIVVAILLNVLLGLFLFRLEILTDSDALFMPTDSEARLDERHVKDIFKSSYYLTNNFYMHQMLDLGTYGELLFQTCEQENILQEKYMSEIKKINEYILKNTRVTLNDTNFGFEDVCARRNGKCLVDGEDLLSKDFYEDWLYDSMLKKTRLLKEREELKNGNSDDEQEAKPIQSEFNMYIKMGGGLTELSYVLGIKSF